MLGGCLGCWYFLSLVLVFTHTVVAAPARAGFGCVAHLLQGFCSEVAQLPQATVVEHPGADPAGVKIIGRPYLAHITHLVAWRLRQKWKSKFWHKLRLTNVFRRICVKESDAADVRNEAGSRRHMKPSKCSLATFYLTCYFNSQLPAPEPKLDLSFLTGTKAKLSVQYGKCSKGRLKTRQQAVCKRGF